MKTLEIELGKSKGEVLEVKKDKMGQFYIPKRYKSNLWENCKNTMYKVKREYIPYAGGLK